MADRVHNIPTQTLTVSSSAVDLSDFGFSQAQIDGALSIKVSTTQDVRYRSDGTAPTATVGHVIAADDTQEFGGAVQRLELIRVSSDAEVTITLDTLEVV